MRSKRIIIIGGGFGGIRAAKDLEKHVYKDAEILLIDKDGYHEFSSDYYKIASLRLSEKQSKTAENGLSLKQKFHALRGSSIISLKDIIDENKIRIMIDEVLRIDAENKCVKTANNGSIDYTWLIVAAGSVSDFYSIEGIRDYALELKTANDALNIRNSIDELFISKGKHETIRLVICGGGYTGCELAGELIDYVHDLSGIHDHPKENFSILIVESKDRLIPPASRWASEKTQKHLTRKGVKISLQSHIIKATPTDIKTKEGDSFDYDVLIWTAGVKAGPICETIKGAELDDKKRLVVDEYLKVPPYDNIFAIGDSAFYKKNNSAMTAQNAIIQGRFVAYFLKRTIHKMHVFSYHFHESSFIIPLGGKYAIADIKNIKISGFVAWLMRRFIALNYFSSILDLRRSWKMWRKNDWK
ncbi:MAG: hypothetical protein COU46_03060 [Candidatus Niyogibacteria bacterium CG10_big_fil_rev_8_21_14_0_10_42_19]|uniref:FAD/NAD(P)-binding domain-containing protein n=1 Tax=Candidatus Niyogibacteria bacterium CG10_big_fil_rev_8_21_14_0_10_42_19 TaxID=1974725 RepID=A0A2H0TEZ1_9BACT|nr:MAG: hypothetical protein COU46_03060 [Candidatus Niyogibacteria bacterium CG10_big_fil_rev_8_21_14_0_10_42_19]